MDTVLSGCLPGFVFKERYLFYCQNASKITVFSVFLAANAAQFKLLKDSGKSVASVVSDARNANITTQTNSYTLVIEDAGKIVRMNKSTANTLTIPANSSAAFAAGTMIAVIQTGAGTTSVVAAFGVSVNGVVAGVGAISGPYKGVMLIKTAADDWDVLGAIGVMA